MTEISMEERISIRESARALKKYGSTSNNVKRPENYIKHEVAESDTLQGLALKYGVTTEQIRRANRLWANDSLFLRKTLLIPVPGDGITSPVDVVLLENEQSNYRVHNNNNDREDGTSDPSYNDFLVKIDCAIASTKNQVMMSQDNSQFMENGSLFVRRKSALSRLKQERRKSRDDSGGGGSLEGGEGGGRSIGGEEIGEGKWNRKETVSYRGSTERGSSFPGGGGGRMSQDPPLPAVLAMTQGRRVRSSLQRLERAQDEMFEL